MHAVELLRLPLAFGRGLAGLSLSEGGAVATRTVAGGTWRAAASKVVMWSGRHFVQFTVMSGDFLTFGVIRPDWDVEGEYNASNAIGHCFYNTGTGSRFPGHIDWEGRHAATVQGDRIGMLLDLDQGSMTVWKNDEKLGVMQAEGLTGPLCWAAEAFSGGSARIESAPAP